MRQPLRATSLTVTRIIRWVICSGLLVVCAAAALWSVFPVSGGGAKATGSMTAGPNPPSSTTLPNQIGRLTSWGNGQRRTAYEYDELGRTTRTVHNFDGQSKPFTTAYGLPQHQVGATGLGTVPATETFPDNERIDYTYDAGGAQQSIKTTPSGGPQQTIISSIFRNSRGQTIAATYGNGAIGIYKYNEATDLRLNQIKTAAGGTLTITGGVPQLTGGTTLQDYGYSFDNNGNVIGVTDAVTPTLNATYGYDSLDQLTSMTPAGQPGLAYTYDRIGNLTGKEGTTQTYYTGGLGQGPHALATSGGVSYNYDNNGNLVSTSNGTNISWNSENMPTSVVQSGVTMYQKFFVGESLWKKVEPSGTTYYLPSMRIENGQVRKFFGSFAERSSDGSLKFYHDDHLGSASVVTDFVNNVVHVVSRQSYMPYGSDRFIDPNGTFTPKYQFNFKEKESTGFYDYGARLYNSATGRWLSADTEAGDGLNRYAYVSNNPLRYADPTGHDSESHIYDEAYIQAANTIMRLGPDDTFTLHARGMLNGDLDPRSVRKMQRALGGKVAGIPNSTGFIGAGMAGLFGPLAPWATDRQSVVAWARTIDAWNSGGKHGQGLRLSSFSNGVNVLEQGLRVRTPKNLKEILIMNPNTNLATMWSIYNHSQGANIRIYIGKCDQFDPVFVLGVSMVTAFEGKANVSVFGLENRDHDNVDMSRGMRRREEKPLLDHGKITPQFREWVTPHSPSG
jgi:RHS repeat-associated protein